MSVRKTRRQNAALKEIRECLPSLEIKLLKRIESLVDEGKDVPEGLLMALAKVGDLRLVQEWTDKLAAAIERNASILLPANAMPNSAFGKLRGYGVQYERKLHKDERKSSTGPKYRTLPDGRIERVAT